MKANRILGILSAAVLMFVGTGPLAVRAESLLAGKKWTNLGAISNVGGALQGAAYYGGNIYQFADAGIGHGIYNIAAGTWTEGGAINTGYLAKCHFGSACFGPESTRNYTVNGVAKTSSYPLLFVTGHDTSAGSRALIVNVIDYQQKTLVASIRLVDTGSQDDQIAAYDFEGGKLYLIGYPGNVLAMAPWVIREYSGISFSRFTTTSQTVGGVENVPVTDMTGATYTSTTVGGPNASGIQEDLLAGTLQDCQYIDGKICFVVTRGSRYNRTEWVRVHEYDVATKKVVKTAASAINSEPEGFVYDGSSFYVTTGGDGITGRVKLFKLANGSGYDDLNFQPATKNGDYYEISTASQFVWFKQQVFSGCTTIKARLTADIDMSGQADPFTYYVYDETTPRTFDAQYAFRGEFDGNGHAIKNVSITGTPHYNDGLFPYVAGANIHDLTVTGSLKTSKSEDKRTSTDNDVQNVGFIGKMNGGTLTNINLIGWSVTAGSGVSTSVNVNQLIGLEAGSITKTNILLADPSGNTHAGNGGAHSYINGFCSLSDANPSTDGYYETPSGSGTSADPYLISNAGKLWWFAKNVNGRSTGNQAIHAKLTADINMEGSARGSFPGIGVYQGAVYAGTFDGQGHTISNFYMKSSDGRAGLFSYTVGATIKNFNLSGTMTLTGGQKNGSVIGWADTGTALEKIYSSVDVTLTGTPAQVGGLAGSVTKSTVSQCRYSGTVSSSSAYGKIAGFAGALAGGKLVDCLFDGTLTLSVDNSRLIAGGMTSSSIDNAGNEIANCLMNGTINIAHPVNNVSGSLSGCGVIIGLISKYSFTCTNTYYNSTTISSGLTTDNPSVENNNGTAPAWSMSVHAVTPNASGFSWGAVKNELNDGRDPHVWGINGDKAAYPLPNEEDKDVTPVVKYTITFNDWDGSEIQSGQVVEGADITKPSDPERSGYRFDGWTTDGTSIVSWPRTATGNTTFTAKYSVNTAAYTNGFKDGGQKTDADYYEEPSLVDGVYQIDNAGKLWWLANYVNTNANTAESVLPGDELKAKAVLTADINMEGSARGSFPGIGYRRNYTGGAKTTIVGLFSGSFDGQGHTISNFYMSNSSSWKALVNLTGNGAVVRKFFISGQVDVSGGMQFGSAVGRVEGTTTVEDVHSSVNFTSAAGKTISAIGGIIGQCSGTTTLNRCRYNGTITGNSSYNSLGGIIGNAESSITVKNCLFDGAISSTSTVAKSDDDTGIKIGGICARNNNVSTITNCLSIGTITVNASSEAVDPTKSHVGIIFGTQSKTSNLTITNTFYSLSKCTSGIGAVGLNNSSDKTKSAPTLITTQTWAQIKTALNAGSSPQNWGVNSKVYPVPGETDGTPATQYTITFNSMGGSDCDPVTDTENTVITLPTPTRSGYSFDGWNTEEDGSGTSYSGGADYTVTADATLYAQWTAVPSNYDADGFHVNFDTVSEDEKYEAPELITSARCAELGIASSYASDGYYEVKNAGNMFWISKHLDATTNTRKYVVTADIDMKGDVDKHKNWKGIGDYNSGNSAKHFCGTFDGLGHKFTKFYLNATSDRLSLFNLINGATLKNFSIDGNVEVSDGRTQISAVVARVQGDNESMLSDIHSSVNFTVPEGKKASAIGGIIGQCSGHTTLNRCRFSGTITGSLSYNGLGGIIGKAENPVTVNNCLFDGTISSNSTQTQTGADSGIMIGGICSRNNNKTTITNCLSIGTITVNANADASHVGIIYGVQINTNKLTITNTFYRTEGSSTGLGAVGLNCNTDTTPADPTLITTQEWPAIRTALGRLNWQIDQTKYARDYPIPEYREHTHTYDKYGYCTSDDCSHSPMPSVIENGCHMISNVAQLKAFRDAVKAAAKGTAVNGKLVQDIDFDGYTGSFGEPIGVNETRPYVGEFDGQNHTINAFAMELDNTYHFTGLFGCAGDDDHAEQKAEIRNFRISGSIKSNYVSSEISVCKEAHIGVVARLTNGSVEGVSSSVAFANNACSSAHFGGVVGCSSGSKTPKSISNCQFTGSITADAYNSIGGIVGYSQGNLELVSNYFGGTITLNCTAGNTTYLGGLLGYSGSDGRKWDMYYNVSYGTLTPSAGGTTYQGALFGHTSLLTGSNFAGNYTKIDKSTEEQNIEGIVKDATLTPDEITAKLGIHWCVRDDGITLGTDNIVSVDARKNYVLKYIYIDDKADSLTWKYSNFDKEALSVKVSKVVYVRAAGYMTNDYITTCLPFAMDASSLPGGSQSVVLQYDHMDNGDAMFIPVLDHRCQAGVPYLLKLPDTAKGAEWRIELTGTKGITLIDTVNNPSTASTNIFGAFRTGVINTGYYKLHPDGNRFVKTRSGSHCFPYRAYLNVKAATGTTSVNIETE